MSEEQEMKIETIQDKYPNGQPRWMKVIKLMIPWPKEDSEPKEFITKRMNFGERSKFINECIHVKVQGRNPTADVDMIGMQQGGLKYGIHKAPFPITQENIENLETYVADPLYAAVDKLNSLGEITSDAIQAGGSSAGPTSTEATTKK